LRQNVMLRFLARRRVPLGFLAGIAALWLADPTPRMLAVGATVAVIGEAIRIWAAGHLEKGREVTSSGPYRLTRHPLYVGSTIIGVGLAIASASIVVALLVIVYLGVTLSAAIATEEAHLTEKFGGAYPEYREGRVAGVSRRFSVARAMKNREYRAVAGLLAVLALLTFKAL
jgi:protein-S-isoprenylcysteine O-methyltransferase Ste14